MKYAYTLQVPTSRVATSEPALEYQSMCCCAKAGKWLKKEPIEGGGIYQVVAIVAQVRLGNNRA